MPMPPYPIYCITKGCKNIAGYKIAGRWSDGVQSELKTFALCCEECLPRWLHTSRAKHKASRLAPGETLDPPGIYRMERGRRDRILERLEDLEKKLEG
ncbi:MAG: hypothetical protein HY040_19980 [Planctomycetes bacterium]|nr:hypothetical protein [Planctomycetota bacterium]